ncbi:MAG TPA: TolC family protein, partial [Bdellovibrionales bacterium]|nr:TolC family protein [Bdellovibrionales bacterium]
MKASVQSFLKAAILGVSVVALGAATCVANAQPKAPAKASAEKTPKPPEKAPPRVGKLTLEKFLKQVREQNGAYKSAEETEEGAKLRSDEWKLLTRPNLIGNYTHGEDYRETGSTFQGDAARNRSWYIGVQQQFGFGLSAELKYTVTDFSIPNINRLAGEPEYTTAGPSIEFKQSLWRNFFGNETEAQQEQIAANAGLTKFSSNFQKIQYLAQAEAAYWRLALAREAVSAARETYERAIRLRDYTAGRKRLELVDRSDVLQSDSALLARQLELQAATDEEKSASRALNTFRETNSDAVEENLVEFDAGSIDKLKIPERAQFRSDVLAEEQRLKLAAATAKIGLERNKPTVDLIGALGFTGRDVDHAAALDESWQTDNPNYAIGVQMTVPLDIGNSSDARAGYRREAAAADVAYKTAVFQQERLWEDLTQRFQDSVERFKIASKMEASQREKLDYEKVRQNRGRTTTYQV